MEKIFIMNKVSKIYKNLVSDNHALNNIDLTLNRGEIIVILGPSGSGKSTMLNILSGIDSPTNGDVYFEDISIDKLSDNDLTEYRANNLGFIFQSYNLIPNLTVKENIELGSNLTGSPLDINRVIDIVGLKDHSNKYPYQLSGGQMQRVSIARALVKNPKVLFCDEPTGALDERTGKKVLSSLQEINREYNTTMIIVTHNPSIANMANTVIKMNSGKIVSVEHNAVLVNAEDLGWA